MYGHSDAVLESKHSRGKVVLVGREAEGPSKCALPASDIKGQVPELETVLDTDEY